MSERRCLQSNDSLIFGTIYNGLGKRDKYQAVCVYSCLIIYDADSAITARLKLQTNNFSGHKICIFKLIILQNTLESTI